jgi:hypothetical protein
MQSGAHHLIHHIEGGKGGGIYRQQTGCFCQKTYLPFPGAILPDDTISSQGSGQDNRSFIFVNFIFCQINDVEMILAELLEMTEIRLTYGMAPSKGGSLEFTGANLSNVMRQFVAYSVLQVYCLQHHVPPFSGQRVVGHLVVKIVEVVEIVEVA